MKNEHLLRRALILAALIALALGLTAAAFDLPAAAQWCWIAGTLPVILALGFSIARDLKSGRMGVEAVALISMIAALALGAALAAAVVAVMYAGGGVLEDFAVSRAERDLKALVDRAPRAAHRRDGDRVSDILADDVEAGDILLVRAGEIVPADGVILAPTATLDESALTGEPSRMHARAHRRHQPQGRRPGAFAVQT
jgi:cation transport ATPase